MAGRGNSNPYGRAKAYRRPPTPTRNPAIAIFPATNFVEGCCPRDSNQPGLTSRELKSAFLRHRIPQSTIGILPKGIVLSTADRADLTDFAKILSTRSVTATNWASSAALFRPETGISEPQFGLSGQVLRMLWRQWLERRPALAGFSTKPLLEDSYRPLVSYVWRVNHASGATGQVRKCKPRWRAQQAQLAGKIRKSCFACQINPEQTQPTADISCHCRNRSGETVKICCGPTGPISMTKSRNAIAICLGFFLLTSLPATAKAEIPWINNVATAQQMAAASGRLVLVHFSSVNCPPCARLERTVFSQPSIAHSIVQQYVPVKINVDHSPEILNQYGVVSWPSDVLLAADGTVLHRTTSPADGSSYVSMLGQIAWRHKSQPSTSIAGTTVPVGPANGQSFFQSPQANGTNGTIYTPNFVTTSQSLGTGLPPAQSFDRANFPPASGGSPPAPYAAQLPPGASPGYVNNNTVNRPTVPGPSQMINNQYYAVPRSNQYTGHATPPATGLPSHAIAEMNGPNAARTGMLPNNGVAPNTGATANQLAGVSANGNAPPFIQSPPQANVSNSGGRASSLPGAQSPATVRNGPASSELATSRQRMPPQNATGPFADSATQPAQQTSFNAQPTAGEPRAAALGRDAYLAGDSRQPNSANSQLGLEGFCPVTLLQEEKWKEGDKRWGVRHRGRVYLFASPAAQQAFLSEPDRYCPALAGYDPVVFAETGQFANGFRRHGVRFYDQVFLFSSEDSLDRFWQDPSKFTEPVRQATAATSNLK